jgi:hypothetical protein
MDGACRLGCSTCLLRSNAGVDPSTEVGMTTRTPRLRASRDRLVAGASIGALLLTATVVSAPTATAAVNVCTVTAGVTTCVWDEPGGSTWVVPSGVTSATVEVAGAQGGGSIGGRGGQVTAAVTTVPGTSYGITIGGRGQAGGSTGGGAGGFGLGAPGGGAQPLPGATLDPNASGAGGGGRTIFACSGCAPLLIGGGGGGDAGRLLPFGPDAGIGGGGGLPAAAGTAGGGGNGGGGGAGATATGPGAGGSIFDLAPPSPCGIAPENGRAGDSLSVGFGGFGGFGCIGGGGGGGGHSGGGGGAAGFRAAGGGGGGSNFAAATVTAVQHVAGARQGDGRVRISYVLPDTTPPVTTITLSPAAPDGGDGWYRSAVGVSVVSTDVASGVAQTRCVLDPPTVPTGFADLPASDCAVTSIGSDGDHTIYAGSRDVAGNVSALASAALRIDRTPPSLAPVVSPATVALNSSATADPGASDTGSGLASSSCDAVTTATAGSRTVECRATDVAGNTTTVQVPYTVVGNRFAGFFSPVDVDAVNVAKAGRTIPLKWRVTDPAGVPVSDLTGVSVSVASLPCQLSETHDLPVESAAGGSGFQNLGDGYYQFNWQTPKAYAGSCKTLRVDIGDGIARTAQFHFTR